MKRSQESFICRDLDKKMVFIVGPRQVGKTWLAKSIAARYSRSHYLNYDNRNDRDIIMGEKWLPSSELLVFDEIHKMSDWKNYLKGIYDTKPDTMRILVTGSARLDTFKSGGDSLVGRYFLHHLLPLSCAELNNASSDFGLERLVVRGGFPEPFLADSDNDAERWRKLYSDGLIRYDILDFENIHNLKALQTVFELLRERVGSPISYSSIARDCGISSATAKKYVDIFEALFIVFKVVPFSRNIGRALLKEPKIYFYDTGLVKGNDSIKLENSVAGILLKNAVLRSDYTGKEVLLQYIRTKDGKEIDFCMAHEGKAETFFEVKYSDSNISPQLYDFCSKQNVPGIQLVYTLRNERREGPVEVRSAESYLQELTF